MRLKDLGRRLLRALEHWMNEAPGCGVDSVWSSGCFQQAGPPCHASWVGVPSVPRVGSIGLRGQVRLPAVCCVCASWYWDGLFTLCVGGC